MSTGTNQPQQPPRKKLSLSDAIIGSGEDLQERIVAQGQAGIGKTEFAAASEDSFFLLSPSETGLHTLMRSGLVSDKIPSVEVTEWLEVFDILQELLTAKHSRKTLVVDTIDGLFHLAESHVLATVFKGDNSADKNGFNCFAAGSRHTAKLPWQELLAAFDRLHREPLKMQIILLAHTGKSPFRNPTGDDFDRLTPEMYRDGWTATYNWSDITLFMDRPIVTNKGKGETKAKGRGIGDRTIQTEYTIWWDAKNRHNLPSEISMGTSGKEAWDNFTEAIENGRKK